MQMVTSVNRRNKPTFQPSTPALGIYPTGRKASEYNICNKVIYCSFVHDASNIWVVEYIMVRSDMKYYVAITKNGLEREQLTWRQFHEVFFEWEHW